MSTARLLSKFQARALDYQANKNQNRTKSARWNDAKVQRAADAMYDTFLDGIYTKLRNAIKINTTTKLGSITSKNTNS